MRRYLRELAAASALAALLIIVGVLAPSFFRPGNLRDLAVSEAPLLIVAIGATLVVLVGQIDISVGSLFAVCAVSAGWLARGGLPVPLLFPGVMIVGAVLGAVNGVLVGRLRLPAIIVTLAMMVAWRDALNWVTQGAWIQGLPTTFQWLGLGESSGEAAIVIVAFAMLAIAAVFLRAFGGGRAILAVGSDTEAARLSGIEPTRVVFWVFVVNGALVGLAALLDAVRFSSVPSNGGQGLELTAIAAVVVGGTSITGGRGTVVGTLIGIVLLGSIGTALTFLGINPYWERAIQGAIILAALASEFLLGRLEQRTSTHAVHGIVG